MKTIIVTGAAGDIGSAIITHLQSDGYRVIGVTHTDASALEVQKMHTMECFVADLGSYEDIAKLGQHITQPLEWLITAHGYIDAELDFMKATPENIERTFRVNTLSQIYLAQTFLPILSRGIVMISSTAGINANGKVAAYSASKAGVNSLTQGFARNKNDSIFIALCPGPTKGVMREKIGASGGQEPKAVADALLAIIALESAYTSGDVVSVKDGVLAVESRLTT